MKFRFYKIRNIRTKYLKIKKMNWTIQRGKIDVIIGPMVAGKTTEILRRITVASELDLSSLFIGHSCDDRSSQIFSTHNPLLVDHKITNLKNVDFIRTNKLETVDVESFDIIAIDEAQFFTNLKNTVLSWTNQFKKHVIIGGLILDYKGENFGELRDIIGHANNIALLKPFCKKCLESSPKKFTNATYTLRLGNQGGQIEVGGIEKYWPVCRDCFFS